MSRDEFLCTIHNVDFSVSWRNGKPEDAYAPCPICAAQDCKAARSELALIRAQRDALLQCIDLKRCIEIKETAR